MVDVSDMVVGVVEDSRGFAELEEEWEDLHRRCPRATPFQSWTWLYSWWEYYGGGYELRLITVRNPRGLLVGIFPFMVEFRSDYVGRLLFVGTGLSDYLDVIVRVGWEDKDFGSYIPGASQKALQRYQWSSLYIWDAVEIAHIGDSSCLALLRGEEPYKLRWSPRIIPTDRLILGQHRTARIPFAGYHALRPRAKLYAGSRSAPLWIKSAVGKYRTLRHRVNHSRDNLVTGVFSIFRPTGASRLGSSNLETMHSLPGVT
jgi:hypothetical protein